MDKYRRIKKEPDKTEAFEVRVTNDTLLRSSLAYVARLFDEKHEKVIIKGMGFVISKALSLATLVRHRFLGLHQIVDFGTLEIVDEYFPIEEGLDNVVVKKKVPNIVITLSFKQLEQTHPGYSAPLPKDDVQPYEPFGMRRGGFRDGYRGGYRGGFRGSRRRGRPSRRGSYEERDYEERGYDEQERPRARRGWRGRGRFPRRYSDQPRPPRFNNREHEREDRYEEESAPYEQERGPRRYSNRPRPPRSNNREYEREDRYEEEPAPYEQERRPRRPRSYGGPRRAPRYGGDDRRPPPETRRPAEHETMEEPPFREYDRPRRPRGRRPRYRYAQDEY